MTSEEAVDLCETVRATFGTEGCFDAVFYALYCSFADGLSAEEKQLIFAFVRR